MKKYLILCIPIFLFINYINAQDSIPNLTKKSTIYIIRNDLRSLLFTYDFYNNNNYIGGLNGRNYLKVECDNGNQLFWASADNNDFLEVSVNSEETYIIEVKSKIGFLKGGVKLNLVDKNDENYNFLKNRIIEKEPVQFSPEEIERKYIKRKKFITKSLNKYKSQKERKESFYNRTIAPLAPTGAIKIESDSVVCPIILDFNFVDFPFSKKSIDISGATGLISNPSMSQSLNIASSFYSFTREGTYKLMSSNIATKPYSKYSAIAVDFLAYFPMPLASGWLHEEFHRSVLEKHNGYSYNEMNNFPINKTIISVFDVKDDNLIRLKANSPQDMVRMSEAGIEGEYMLANNINKTAFYYNAKSISITPLLIALNSSIYVLMCSSKNIDKETIAMNQAEGTNIKKRDLLGLDFLSYTYDLFRPDEPYQNRGIHPSGVGIDRYIKRSQLTTTELSYLKQQGLLQLINFANPISLLFTSFTIQEKENGDNTRANLYFNHMLTSFGYDISTTALLHYNKHNYAFSIHNYANYYKWFSGLEVETYNYMLGVNKIKKPIPVSAKVMLWTQPQNQLFFSKNYQLGGLIEAKIYYPINNFFQPYISITAKTSGWVAGNVYLEPNISGSLGLRAYL